MASSARRVAREAWTSAAAAGGAGFREDQPGGGATANLPGDGGGPDREPEASVAASWRSAVTEPAVAAGSREPSDRPAAADASAEAAPASIARPRVAAASVAAAARRPGPVVVGAAASAAVVAAVPAAEAAAASAVALETGRPPAATPGYGAGAADPASGAGRFVGGGGAGMGGAILNLQGEVTVINSTIAWNSAAGGAPQATPGPAPDQAQGLAGPSST